MTVGTDSGGGKFLDEAVATGVCGPAAGTAGADAAVGVPLEARVSLNLPEVNAALGALLPRELPRTGGRPGRAARPRPHRRRAGSAAGQAGASA